MKRILRGASAICCALIAGSALAETLEITGEFGAPFREASLLRSLAIGRFEGQDGPALGFAIENALSNSQFTLMAGRAGRSNADGLLSGGINANVQESGFIRKDKKCVERTADNKKCAREEKVDTRCRRRIVTVQATFRLVSADGRILYSEQKPARDEQSWCGGQQPSEDVETVIERAVQGIANNVRADLVPDIRTYEIRVRESTKGMTKDSAEHFKQLVRATKNDPRAACAGWQAMQAYVVRHPSLAFNVGLCAEQRGEYERAIALYQEASSAGATEAREGINRANRLIAGREDAKLRASN